MSRVGKMPIAVPQGVDVSITAEQIVVKGTLGTLVRAANPLVSVKKEDGQLEFAAVGDAPGADAMSGTMRALVANMVNGVSKGFEKKPRPRAPSSTSRSASRTRCPRTCLRASP